MKFTTLTALTIVFMAFGTGILGQYAYDIFYDDRPNDAADLIKSAGLELTQLGTSPLKILGRGGGGVIMNAVQMDDLTQQDALKGDMRKYIFWKNKGNKLTLG